MSASTGKSPKYLLNEDDVMDGVELTVTGLTELNEDLRMLMQKYPDKAGDLLRKGAREFRKEYTHSVQAAVKHASGQGKALELLRNTKVYPIQGYGARQYVEVGATSPHFHLFERGHELYNAYMAHKAEGYKKSKNNKDKNRAKIKDGHVEGRFVMQKTIDAYEDKIPEIAQKMYDELLKEGNLL